MDTLISIKELKVSFYQDHQPRQVVRGFNLSVDKGEVVGVLGESGCGKTVSSMGIAKLIDDSEGQVDSGEVQYDGTDLMTLSEKELRKIRGKEIAYVFQNPSEALNPYKKVGKQIKDLLRAHWIFETKENILEGLREVGIKSPETVYDMYPKQLSGGQNQRVMIAACILLKPKLLIADEPTSAIDASLRQKVLDLFKRINEKHGMSILIITHDFDVAEYVCDRLVIMYGGLVVEEGSTKDILWMPLHPYTEALIQCAHTLKANEGRLTSLEGRALSPDEFSDACPFYHRCQYAKDICAQSMPEMRAESNDNSRSVRCHFNKEDRHV